MEANNNRSLCGGLGMRTLQSGFSVALLMSVLLVGCGGGGGGGGSTPAASTGATPAYPITSAISAYGQANHEYNLSSASGGNTYTMQFSFTPGAQSTFQGQLASTVLESLILSENGAVILTTSGTSYFIDSPYTNLGYVSNTGVTEVASGQQPLPASATVGQSGPYDTVTVYTGGTGTAVASTIAEIWSLQAATATTAWACLNGSEVFTNGSPTVGIASCYEIDTSGNVSAFKLTLSVNGQSLTFQ